MKKMVKLGVVVGAVLSLLSLVGFADACDSVTGILDQDNVSPDVALGILNELIPGFATSLPAAGGSLTKGELASLLYDALGLQPTLLERLFGVSEDEKMAICQRNGLMVLGDADDPITGMEFAAILVGLTSYMVSHGGALDLTPADMASLGGQHDCVQGLLPTGMAAQLIPALIPTPTS